MILRNFGLLCYWVTGLRRKAGWRLAQRAHLSHLLSTGSQNPARAIFIVRRCNARWSERVTLQRHVRSRSLNVSRSPMVLGLFDVRTRSPAYHRSRSALRKSENAGAGGRPRTLSSEASGCATSSLLSEVRLACGRPEAIMPVQLLSATTIFHETQIR